MGNAIGKTLFIYCKNKEVEVIEKRIIEYNPMSTLTDFLDSNKKKYLSCLSLCNLPNPAFEKEQVLTYSYINNGTETVKIIGKVRKFLPLLLIEELSKEENSNINK